MLDSTWTLPDGCICGRDYLNRQEQRALWDEVIKDLDRFERRPTYSAKDLTTLSGAADLFCYGLWWNPKTFKYDPANG